MMSSRKKVKSTYPIRRNLPVAKFYYQGSHSHPVRRTVLITESTPRYIRGYELREGAEVRTFPESPIKTFARSKIAKVGQCGRRLRSRTPQKYHTNSTFQTLPLVDLVKEGA